MSGKSLIFHKSSTIQYFVFHFIKPVKNKLNPMNKYKQQIYQYEILNR